MKIRIGISFIKWLLKRLFGGVIRIYNKYDEMVVNNTLLAVMPTMVLCMGSVLPIVLVFVTFGITIPFFFPTWLTASIIIVGNYFRIVIRELYNDFKRERQELFNMMKD